MFKVTCWNNYVYMNIYFDDQDHHMIIFPTTSYVDDQITIIHTFAASWMQFIILKEKLHTELVLLC